MTAAAAADADADAVAGVVAGLGGRLLGTSAALYQSTGQNSSYALSARLVVDQVEIHHKVNSRTAANRFGLLFTVLCAPLNRGTIFVI